jgi:hypothetical protein
MTQLIEIKDKMIKFFCYYEFYMMMVVKFILALTLFLIINTNIGYMSKISSIPVAVILAMICCLLPVNGTICLAAVVVLLDMYELSAEVALVTLILFAIIYLVYFRFAPKDGIAAILTPITFRMNIPYLMPMAAGLLRPVYSIASIICGTILYFFFDGVRQSTSSLTVLTNADDSSATSKLNVIIGQITGNKEMVLTIVILVLAFLIVYLIRKMNIEHAWTIAIISGTLFQIVGLIAGYLILNISGKIVGLLIGSIVSMLFAFLIQFVCMDLDYARTERVQFCDDEYYYYVKAVPKKMVTSTSKTVKRFSTTGTIGKRIDHSAKSEDASDETTSRKVIAKELEIDEDLLK